MAEKKTAVHTRKSRVAEIAEDLKIIAGDTVKEAVEATRKTAKKTTAKVKAAAEKVSKEAEKTAKEAKETIDNRKTIATELAEDARTVIADTVKEAEEKIEGITMPETRKETKKPARGNKKKPVTPEIMIQSVMGGEITIDEILSRIAEQTGEKTVTNIYIKAEENRAYYTAGEESGSIELWQ